MPTLAAAAGGRAFSSDDDGPPPPPEQRWPDSFPSKKRKHSPDREEAAHLQLPPVKRKKAVAEYSSVAQKMMVRW